MERVTWRELAESLISYIGYTSADGNPAGTTLVCGALADYPDYDGNQVVIINGANRGQTRDINGTTTLGTVTPHVAFDNQVLEGTRFAITAFRLTPAEVAALTSMVETDQYYDRVFYDSINGVAGTAWPTGTPQVPSNTIADVIAICAARNLKVIDVAGALALGAAMQDYTFIGHRHEDITDTFNLNNQNVDKSRIIGCILAGQQGGGLLTLKNCIVYLMTDFQGIANDCDLYGSAMSLLNGGVADLSKCNSVHSDLTITVNTPGRASFKECSGNCTFVGQTGGPLYIRGYKGTLVIDAMTAGTCDIYANGADITINANCIGTGTINIYGNARVTDNHGAGTTVNNYTIQLAGGSLALTIFTQETHAAVNANGINWIDLLDKSPGGASPLTKPTKICGFMVTVSAGWAGKARLRITDGAGTTKIFPFQAYYTQDTEFTSAVQVVFNFEVVVPIADGYKVQFCSSAGDVGAGFDVTLDNLDVIEVGA